MTPESAGRKGLASFLRVLACSIVAGLLCSIQLPLHASDDAQSGYLPLAAAHRAVWKIHNIRPGESIEDKDYYDEGTTFAIGPRLFVTNHHVLKGVLNYTHLADVRIVQEGRPAALRIDRVLILSQVYDLALFETKETVNGYLGLADDVFKDRLHNLTLLGYPDGTFRNMKQKASVTYEDAVSYGIATHLEDHRGASGGPVLNASGEVIAVLANASKTIALPMKLKYVKNLVLSYYLNEQTGFTDCAPYDDARRCFKESFGQLMTIAQEGNPWAQYELSRLYERNETGTGIDWLKKAANSGFPRALRPYAVLLLYGRGVDKDEDLALRLMRESASKNYAPAQHDLADMLLYGIGAVKDIGKSVSWREKAVEQGVGLVWKI